MKHVLITSLLVLLALCANRLEAQPTQSDTYYRYFTVELADLKAGSLATLKSNPDSNPAIDFKQSCNSNSKILVTVDAAYPKRIEDIKLEINNIVIQKLPEATIRATELISSSDHSNFCE